jgi:hypothetical protein
MVTRLQGVTRDAFAAQLAAATPFHGPGFHLARIVRGFDMNERMGLRNMN